MQAKVFQVFAGLLGTLGVTAISGTLPTVDAAPFTPPSGIQQPASERTASNQMLATGASVTNHRLSVIKTGTGGGTVRSSSASSAATTASARTPRIVGGTPAQDGAWPWQIALFEEGFFSCGGSLLSPEWVVTAAHCVVSDNGAVVSPSLLRIRAGSLSNNVGGETRTITQVIAHPSYDPNTTDNDIALLRLSSPVSGQSIGAVAPLLPDQESALAPNGGDSIVTGWGATSEGGSDSPVLLEVTVPLISPASCRNTSYQSWEITDNMICAGFPQGGKDACQGDSGGPLVVADQLGSYRLTGIVSWGEGCARADYPGVYARVARYTDWLETSTGLTFSNQPIDCGTTCSASFAQGSAVMLEAEADTGSSFAGWSGACSGNSTRCTVTLSQAQTVTAVFDQSGEGGECTAAAMVISESFSSGSQQYQSETAIQVTGATSVTNGAMLQLGAPIISFEAGFVVDQGGQVSANAGAVTCPVGSNPRHGILGSARPQSEIAAPDPAVSPALPTDASAQSPDPNRGSSHLAPSRPPVMAASPTALPIGSQAQLKLLGVDLAAMTSALVDADEHWVILETSQPLVSTDTNSSSDVYRLDLLSSQIGLISATASGQAGNGPSGYPAADANGELIVFQSEADNLVEHDTNEVTDLFVHDLALGQTSRITDGAFRSAHPSLDTSGSNLVYDRHSANGTRQILGQTLIGNNPPELLSLPRSPEGSLLDNHHPAISADGRFITYLEQSAAAHPNGVNTCQVHLYDRRTQVYHRQPCPAALANASESARPEFSADGTTVHWQLSTQDERILLANPLSRSESLDEQSP